MVDIMTREAFEARRRTAKQVRQRDSNILAAVSIGGGLAQLLLINWADGALSRGVKLALILPVFLAYMLTIALLIRRMERRQRAASPACPQCGRVLKGMSERVAAATGRCDACGGAVIR